MQRNANRNGFTLIELLVVIAIIAILAAILFPVFGAARRAAQQTTCQSNLKQFGIAFLMYVNDWGALPLPGGSLSDNNTAWLCSTGTGEGKEGGALWPYIKVKMKSGMSNNFWSCPLAVQVDPNYANSGYSPGTNFVMNDYVRCGHSGEGNWSPSAAGYQAGLDPGRCESAADVILLFEAVQNRYGFVNRLGSPYYVPADKRNSAFPNLDPYIPQNYHTGKCDFLFVDGHVASMLPDQTWTAACRDGVKDGISNFTGFKIDSKVKAVYKGCGEKDYWNPHVSGVNYP